MRKIFTTLFVFIFVICLSLAPACTGDKPQGDGSQNSSLQQGDSTQISVESPSSPDSVTENSSFEEIEDNSINKVVLFIGDGMGFNHVHNAELYTNSQAYFSSFDVKTAVDTNSLDGLTDSAAAATAMATGTRTNNGRIATLSDGTNLTSITELAKQAGFGAGVVTSDNITGATPSGFSAHEASRNNSALLVISQTKSPLDFIMGAGAYSNYKDFMQNAGFNYLTDLNAISNESGRFFGCFNDVIPTENTENKPNLTQLAIAAVNYMETNYPGGYFLMIEGAKIDKKSHSKDINAMIPELIDFSNAVKAVDELITGNYSLIVTADHETGGLQRADSVE